jgi:adenylylsulfate kinase-like enzyme
MIYWFIGQPGCGKTSIAKALKSQFDALGNPSIHFDENELKVIFKDINTRKLQLFVEHIEKQGVDVIVSTVNGDRAIREELKQRNKRVIEIYVVNSGSHVREERKYDDFQEPLERFITIDTNDISPTDALRILWNKL